MPTPETSPWAPPSPEARDSLVNAHQQNLAQIESRIDSLGQRERSLEQKTAFHEHVGSLAIGGDIVVEPVRAETRKQRRAEKNLANRNNRREMNESRLNSLPDTFTANTRSYRAKLGQRERLKEAKRRMKSGELSREEYGVEKIRIRATALESATLGKDKRVFRNRDIVHTARVRSTGTVDSLAAKPIRAAQQKRTSAKKQRSQEEAEIIRRNLDLLSEDS